MTDWSDLPSDLLSLITTHLPDLSDLIRFSSVCSQWRSIIFNNSQNPKHHHHHPLPWLLLPSPKALKSKGIIRFLSLSDHRTYSFSLPETVIKRSRISTSDHGWLVAYYYKHKKKQSLVSLVNPITRRTIPLPPLSDFIIWTIKLLKSPSSYDDNSLLLIVEGSNFDCTHVCRVGDSSWKKVLPPMYACYYSDYAVHDGKLFAFSCYNNAETHVFDLDTCLYIAKIPTIWRKTSSRIRYSNFVGTPIGELFLVDRHSALRLVRLEESEKKWKWEKVEGSGFGRYSLFRNLDKSHAICFEPSRFEGWKANCVYFVGLIKSSGECGYPVVWFYDVEKNWAKQLRCSVDRGLKYLYTTELFVPSL